MHSRLARSRRRRLPATVVAVLVLLAAAVAGAVTPDGPAISSAAQAPASSAEQELVLTIGTFPSTLDPTRATTEAELAIQHVLFAPLYRNPGGANGQLQPFLAAGAPRVSADGLSVTIQLRKAHWTDGAAITATDVKTAFERSRLGTRLADRMTAIRSLRAVGPRTVVLTLRQDTPLLDELLSSPNLTPIPTHVVRERGALWARSTKLVSSGPFRLDSVRGQTELVLTKNPRWWAATAVRLRRVVLRPVPPAAATPLFEADRLDAGLRDTTLPQSLLDQWRTDTRLRRIAPVRSTMLAINTRNGSLSEPTIRRGIALALDRAALATRTGDTLDQPLETLMLPSVRRSGAIAPGSGTLLRADGAPDLVAARAQLAAGGWTSSRSLVLAYELDAQSHHELAVLIRRHLAAVGVDVVLRGLPTAAFEKIGAGRSPTSATVDLVLQTWQPELLDAAVLYERISCAAVAAGTNSSNVCDPAVEPARLAALATRGSDARAAQHRNVEQLLTGPSGAMPVVPLVEHVGHVLVQRWVRDYVVHPSGRVDLERVWIERH